MPQDMVLVRGLVKDGTMQGAAAIKITRKNHSQHHQSMHFRDSLDYRRRATTFRRAFHHWGPLSLRITSETGCVNRPKRQSYTLRCVCSSPFFADDPPISLLEKDLSAS